MIVNGTIRKAAPQ